jgi:hypothetical protein
MTPNTVYPIALARLKRMPDVYLWIVDRCPLCAKKHIHGGGSLDGDPRRLLSHRVAHCLRPIEPAAYDLVEAPARTARP